MQKVIVLAAGASSRFWPLASTHHKSFYKVGSGKTVIEYTVAGLLENAEEIDIVVGSRDEGRAKDLFKDEARIKIRVLESPTGGGNAILKAIDEKNGGKFFVTWAEKVHAGQLLKLLLNEEEAIAVRRTEQPENFGIVTLDSEDFVTGLVEKPKREEAPSEYKVTGAYLLDSAIIPLLKKNSAEHYSLEKSLDEYFKSHKVKGVNVEEVEDTGLRFPWDLIDLSKKLMEEEKVAFVHPSAKVSDSAVLKPPYYIGEEAVVGDFALVRDCVYIGTNAKVGAHSEVKNSLIYEEATIHRAYVGDSVIDGGGKLGAGVVLANKRYDRGIVKSLIKGEKMETGKKALGAIIGREANIGVNASIMPGAKIGNKSIVWPGKFQVEDVPDGETSK